ncbi:MAG TPA: hypothetical protein VGM81_19965 [Burkholderiaceae bacterium]
MTARLKPQATRSLALQFLQGASGLALGLAVGMNNAYAGSGIARASATVIEPVPVNTLIGVPVTVADLLAAWHGASGPMTGAYPIRLPDVFAPAEAQTPQQALVASLESQEALLLSEATRMQADGGQLQFGIVAAVSASTSPEADNHDAQQLFITVAFN